MKRTLIAAAFLSVLATGAYAENSCPGCNPADLQASTSLTTDITETGTVGLGGYVNVSNSAGGTVNNKQTADINGSNLASPGTLSAAINGGALSNATGNIGVNIGTGVDNVQSNTVALAKMSAGPVLGAAQIYSTQSSGGNGTISYDLFSTSAPNVDASVGDFALQNATGNIGVNVASGLGNVQNNSLALSASTDGGNGYGGEVIASDQNCQTANATVTANFVGSASLGGYALQGAQGNIGVNIAAGAGNVQHNGLAIASASR